VAVELDGPVVAKVKGTSLANCENVPEWWLVLDDKWELDVPVVAKVKGTSVANWRW